MIKILVAILIALIVILLLSPKCGGGKDKFSADGCETLLPVPGPKDCKAVINYLSAGVPTIDERVEFANKIGGNQDFVMNCSMEDLKTVYANMSAFGDANVDVPPPWTIGINDVVQMVQGSYSTNEDFCRLAKIMTTVPENKCQAEQYTSRYMYGITPQTQATLKKWLSYCK